ncbi:hypothetical protein EIP91_011278 [Steccherinum ochraceum]|uniref:F-box domain-containing protein n=1 Tax=Steccherinum ochraceum TaxID=92696 RepID=A0A4R0R7M1_9APHY|nr:hypothetical protein EIP91_011278 [Steccherinum ochraceum]
MSQRQRPRVPPELCDEIIGYLSADKKTLKACSLASRQWLGSARYHLFNSVAVRAPKDANPPRNLTAFLEFVLANTQLKRHIQCLRISTEEQNFGYGDGWASVCQHDLQEVLLQLPNLRKLVLSRIRFIGCRLGCEARPLQVNPISLKELVFEAGSNDDELLDIVDILSLFGDVEMFSAPRIRLAENWDIDNVLQTPLLPEHLRIRTLATGFDDTSDGVLWEVFRRTPSVHTIMALGAHCASGMHQERLGDFMKDIRATLVHLYLDLTNVFHDGETDQDLLEWDWLALSSYPCLQSIGLELRLTNGVLPSDFATEDDDDDDGDDDDDDGRSYELFRESMGLVNILSTAVESKSIRHVAIKVDFVRYHGREQDAGAILEGRVNWETMREVLDGFGSLETLTFGFIGGQGDVDACRPVLERVLEDFHARGVLRLEKMSPGWLPPGLQIEE